MTMSDGSGSSDDDGDYTLENPQPESSIRYPVHDCCEFEDAETLRVSTGKAHVMATTHWWVTGDGSRMIALRAVPSVLYRIVFSPINEKDPSQIASHRV